MSYKYTLLLCARIGEIIAFKYPSDKTANPTGQNLQVKTEKYKVNMNVQPEYNAAFMTLLGRNRTAPTPEQIAMIQEPVAVFTVTTEKRKGGWIREIALPLNPKWEPWTSQMLEYYNTHKDDTALFPFKRQQIYPVAKKAFKGLQVRIEPYQRAVLTETGEYQYVANGDGKKHLLTETVQAHVKQFSQHHLRRIRRIQLERYYGFTKEERKLHGGWADDTEERYGTIEWDRKSFPKLLQPPQT
ncbi:MAG: hypothetical protein PVH61_31630 [Candidatus Aminicenantes bacterium]